MPKLLKKNKYYLSCILLGLMLVLSGCKLAVLDPKGMVAAGEKQVFLISVVLILLVVVPVIFLSFVFAWRYRAGNRKADYSPHWADSTMLEVIWWLFPALLWGC